MRLYSTTPGLVHVAVCEFPGVRKTRLLAYTQWYSPDSSVCMHHVRAATGAEAKKMAMAEHRARCMGGRK